MNTEQTAALLREAERRGLSVTNCSRWPSTTGTIPRLVPDPPGLATLAGRLRPPGLDPPATPPGRRPARAGAPAVTGPQTAHRQRPRRRITPNANTITTTMIRTHNHVDMAASLVGAGPIRGDATAAHPSKQLGHRQATSHPGSTAALRAGSPGPCTLRPARRSGLAGRAPARPRPC